MLRNVTLQNTETSAQLDNLRPGTRYTVTVVTEAVGLQSSTSKQAVTGTYYGMFLVIAKSFSGLSCLFSQFLHSWHI